MEPAGRSEHRRANGKLGGVEEPTGGQDGKLRSKKKKEAVLGEHFIYAQFTQ